MAYEGKKLYYIEISSGSIKQSEALTYKVNYNVDSEKQIKGINKILSGESTAELDTDGKIKTLDGKTITMNNDISVEYDGSSNWNAATFDGILDGNNHKLEFKKSYVGLFDVLNGTVKNLYINITRPNNDSYHFRAGIAVTNNGEIKNCTCYNSLYSSSDSSGICYYNYGTITGCTYDGSVSFSAR